MANKKKKENAFSLSVFGLIKGTIWYYIRNIFYILLINIVFAYIFVSLRTTFLAFLSGFLNTANSMRMTYGIFFISIFTIFKIIFFGNSVYSMKTKLDSNIFELLSLGLKRFFPVLITLICYILAVILFSVLLILPGIYVFFAFFNAPFLTAVGDIGKSGKGNTTNIVIPKGVDALTTSKELMTGKLFKFIISMTIITTLIYFFEQFIYTTYIENNPDLGNYVKLLIRFALFDAYIIYGALAFVECEVIEIKNEEIRQDKDAEEKAKIYSELSQNMAANRKAK